MINRCGYGFNMIGFDGLDDGGEGVVGWEIGWSGFYFLSGVNLKFVWILIWVEVDLVFLIICKFVLN